MSDKKEKSIICRLFKQLKLLYVFQVETFAVINYYVTVVSTK